MISHAVSETWSSGLRNGKTLRPSASIFIFVVPRSMVFTRHRGPYRENASMCAKRQWNARDCYWIARPAKPGVQSSNTSRVRFTVISNTPMRSRFYHTHIMYKRNWDDLRRFDLIYPALHIFHIRNLLNCVDESCWNMPFKETRLGGGMADDAVALSLPLWLHVAALWRHAVWIRIVRSHNTWMGCEYSLQNLNRPRAIHKHNPYPFETMERVW